MIKGCSKCPRYSRGLLRCLDGYVNPKTIKDGVKGYKMGLLKPCPYTEKGQKVIDKARKDMGLV